MRWILASALLASFAFAAVPYTLPIGVPAKASQVNRNFETLDSLIGDQIEQFSELRESLVAQVDSLRKDLAQLRRKAKADSLDAAERVAARFAADTGWKSLNLPKGTVIGLLATAGPDGYLPGSDKIWQQVESFGGIDGLPVASAPVVAATTSTVMPASPLTPAPAAATDSTGSPKAPTDTLASPQAAPSPVQAPLAAAPATVAPATVSVVSKPVFHWFVKVR